MAETTTIDPTQTLNTIFDKLDRPETLDHLLFILDMVDKMTDSCKRDQRLCGRIWDTIGIVSASPEKYPADQLIELRRIYKLPLAERDDGTVSAEHVETENTSLYLESFRFQTKL
jgi:hypothetical protein